MADITSSPVEPPELITHSSFQLRYDGPAVADGSIEAVSLMSALAGLGELLTRSNELLNGEHSDVSLRVLSKFEKGSFDVSFLLDQSLRDAAAAMLPTLSVLSASQILDIALGAYDKAKEVLSGAARVFKALRGAPPREIKAGSQANTMVIVFGNNNSIITDPLSARLYNDERVRLALGKTTAPLTRRGIDRLEVKRANQVVESLAPPDVGDAPSFDLALSTPEGQHGQPRDLWVRVVKPNFDGGRWTFHDGSAKFGAEVEDKNFQSRVDSREQGFYAGDTFLVRLRSTQHIDKNGTITTRNVVEKVLDKRSSPQQRRLPGSASPTGAEMEDK
jgi:hypothetical protein